ncbi:uncharacterized protein [Engystomops pustulosus]|uniref:uncharacterized protein n=1 Tax=Engystomops pustulosus TaxID=76066 RepID=UPI003AFB7334
MKYIAIFLLVGLSLFSNGNCNEDSNVLNCVVDGVKRGGEVLRKFTRFLCTLLDAQSSGDKEALANAISSVKTFMEGELKCVNLDHLFTNADGVEKSAQEILDALTPSLQGVRLTDSILKGACTAIKGLPECVDGIIKSLTDVVQGLTTTGQILVCESQKKDPNLEAIRDALEQMKCAPNALLNTEGSSDAVVTLVNESLLEGLRKLLNGESVQNLVVGVKCAGSKLLGGQRGLFGAGV